MKSRTALAKASFNKVTFAKANALKFKKDLVKCYICSTALYK